MALGRINKQSVQDMVFQEIKKSILDGTYNVGDKLPSENELCEMMGVSRPSVKLAIQRLSTLGIIETRHGDGSYVSRFDSRVLVSQVGDFMIKGSNEAEITDFRNYLEVMSAVFAMRSASDDDISGLYRIVEKMEAAMEQGDCAQHSRLDYQLHFAIVKSTRNRFFINMYEMISNIILPYIYSENEKVFRRLSDTDIVNVHVHREIVDAIRDRDELAITTIYNEKFSVLTTFD